MVYLRPDQNPTDSLFKCTAAWENQQSALAKTKAQISLTVTAKLIRAFVFATRIVQFLYFLNPKFKPLTIYCDCTARFMSNMVRTTNCWFSHTQAHSTTLPISVHFITRFLVLCCWQRQPETLWGVWLPQ